MINRFIAAFMLWLLLTVVVYAVLAFATLNANVLEWAGVLRFFLGAIPLFLTIGAVNAAWIKK